MRDNDHFTVSNSNLFHFILHHQRQFFPSQLNSRITIQGNRIINIFSGCFLLCEILFVRRVVDLKFRTFFREKGKRIRQNREKSRKN